MRGLIKREGEVSDRKAVLTINSDGVWRKYGKEGKCLFGTSRNFVHTIFNGGITNNHTGGVTIYGCVVRTIECIGKRGVAPVFGGGSNGYVDVMIPVPELKCNEVDTSSVVESKCGLVSDLISVTRKWHQDTYGTEECEESKMFHTKYK